jgi:RNA polymerase sigma-70 factor (ECF subfamily)
MNPNRPDPPAPLPDREAPIDAAWAHRDDLLLYARRLLGAQGELAEDVVQEAFLRLHERLASGELVREARPWLFRVTRNLALDERRRSRRGDDARASLEVVAAQPRGPLELLQGREEARQALEGLESLPPREQRTVILDQAGLAPVAIARRMQTTTNAVHQSLFRARRRMRDARAAAWGLLPLPFIRLFVRAASSPALDRLPTLAPGSGGRFAGGAGLAGLVAAAVIGGGVVADQPVVPHAVHVRSVEIQGDPGPATASVAAPDAGQSERVDPAPVAATATAVVRRAPKVAREGGGSSGRHAGPAPTAGDLSPPGDADDGPARRQAREQPEAEHEPSSGRRREGSGDHRGDRSRGEDRDSDSGAGSDPGSDSGSEPDPGSDSDSGSDVTSGSSGDDDGAGLTVVEQPAPEPPVQEGGTVPEPPPAPEAPAPQ